MGYCLNRLDEPVFIAVSKPLLTELGIHHTIHWRVVMVQIFSIRLVALFLVNCSLKFTSMGENYNHHVV